MRGALLSLLLLGCVSGCGWGSGSVTRVYGARQVEGRYIPPEAYAHYLQATLLEGNGNDRGAADEYESALAIDPESPDTWTRLGAVRCRLGDSTADDAFRAARSLDGEYAPLFREQAACALRRGDAKRARELATRAVELDPDDETATLTLAEAERRSGKPGEALRWLAALVARDPSSERALRALEALEHPAPTKSASSERSAKGRPTPSDVDQALLTGSVDRARALARAAGMPLGVLALRAAALGRSSVALEESERVLSADPDDSDAWIAGLYAASLEGETERFEALSRRLGAEPTVPSSLGARLFAELLARRIGPDAARAFGQANSLPPPADELERRVEERRTSAQAD